MPCGATSSSARARDSPPTDSRMMSNVAVVGHADRDVGRAQLAQAAGPLGSAHHRGHLRAPVRGQLDGEAADATRPSGDEHPAALDDVGLLERAVGGQARDRQGGGGREGQSVGNGGQRAGRHGHLLGPRSFAAQTDHPAPDRRAGAVRGSDHHGSGQVPPGSPARRGSGQAPDLASVERDGRDLDDDLVGGRIGGGHVDEVDPAGPVGCGHQRADGTRCGNGIRSVGHVGSSDRTRPCAGARWASTDSRR